MYKYIKSISRRKKTSSGSIAINNGNIGNMLIELNDNKMVKNDKGEVILHPCKLIEDNGEEGITLGDKYECKVDPNNKAYTFYVLSTEEDGSTNLIMDRNMCEDGTPTDTNKPDKCLVACYEDAVDNNYGPVTAMNYLNNATST